MARHFAWISACTAVVLSTGCNSKGDAPHEDSPKVAPATAAASGSESKAEADPNEPIESGDSTTGAAELDPRDSMPTPTSDDAKRAAVVPPKPFEIVKALERARGLVGIEKKGDELDETWEPMPNAAVFGAGDIEFGATWFETRVGDRPVVVVVANEGGSDVYGHIPDRAHLFVAGDEGWDFVKTQPLYEDGEADYASAPELVALGDGRPGLLYRPSIQGCGAAPCKPEDDFVTSVLHEIKPDGLVEVLRYRGPGCQFSDRAPEMYGCHIRLLPDDGDLRGGLELQVRAHPTKDVERVSFTFEGGRYVQKPTP